MGYYWMSFCDAEKPAGSMFLGALIIEAPNPLEAIERSWELELNPGGEILFHEIPEVYYERIPADWIETRLITRKECEDLENKFKN